MVGVCVDKVIKEAEKNREKISYPEPTDTVLWEDIIRDSHALWKLRQRLDFSTVTRQ